MEVQEPILIADQPDAVDHIGLYGLPLSDPLHDSFSDGYRLPGFWDDERRTPGVGS